MTETTSVPVIGFTDIRKALDGWPRVPPGSLGGVPEDTILGRVISVLETARARGRPESAADLAALLRHAMLARSSPTAPQWLRVPAGGGWPTPEEWRRLGFRTRPDGDRLVLEAKTWRPEWPPRYGLGEEDVFAEVFRGDMVGRSAETPIDPFFEKASGFRRYVCPGQREAIRSVLFMPTGSTLIVNLPTGGGKTLVGQAPFLTGGIGGGLTVFVVPTTALAMDHGRRIREILGKRMRPREIPGTVWHSGLDGDARAAIRRNIVSGTQGILFASPEAVSGALLPTLYAAAASGTLRYLVIDEAHVVDQWGDGFRPAFQMLSGVRRGLLRHMESVGAEPFRTVLMSATLSPNTVATLETLFGPPDRVQMVSAVHLRPEPRYLARRVGSLNEKRKTVLELLGHAPRPFILYVTERGDARGWMEILRAEGHVRLACFHGGTPDAERETIIADWVADRLDGMVATSAFGVGMDKGDVRTIVHATVPESLDRLYQEVGRGGRDGSASISAVVYEDADVGKARGMSRTTIVGDDNAFERWNAMFATRKPIDDDGLMTVDMTAVPPRLRQVSDYNTSWNMRTLILMVRAGMISLDSVPPAVPTRGAAETDDEYSARTERAWEDYRSRIPLRTLDPSHLDREWFAGKIGRERQRGIDAADRSFSGLTDALEGRREMAAVLSDLYRNHAPGRTVLVSATCRGCPADPASNRQGGVPYPIPLGIGIGRIVPQDTSAWRSGFPWLQPPTVTILYPRTLPGLAARISHALKALVSRYGLTEVAAPPSAWSDPALDLGSLHAHAPRGIVIARTMEEDEIASGALPLSRASLLMPWGEGAIPERLLLLERPLHVILAPDDVASDHPLRRYRDTAENSIGLEAFLEVSTR